MDDMILEFLAETNESLSVLDSELVRFEQNPNDRDILSNIFRLMHTIKGTCGFLGLARLEQVAHAGEDVLGKFRDGELTVTPAAVGLILRCIDRIRELTQAIEETGNEPEGEDSSLIAELRQMAEGGGACAGAPETPVPAEGSDPVQSSEGFPMAAELLAEAEAWESVGVQPASVTTITAEMARERSGEELELAFVDPDEVGDRSSSAPEPETGAAPIGAAGVPQTSSVVLTPEAAVAEEPSKSAKTSKESALAQQSIRVSVQVLENLMTLVSEMVLTRNNLLQMIRGQEDNEFSAPLQRLSHITTDLQEGVMKTRMQPIGGAWSKLPRIVRDLAVDLGKKIELRMIGEDTELDRQVLELIKDPLTHMVRNSADHGLEATADRVAAGKPETGTITLRAYHEGGHIIIEISDDGRGLNTARIRQKCLEKGLATEEELAGMSDVQIQQFILKPGFSTADAVTSVSGRGVGMDVVRSNIEQIGGTIQFKSVEGKGSIFTIKIPLTLAIVSALIVKCGKERFAIPQISVKELVRVASNSDNRVESIDNAPVLRLRDRLLPLVSLRDILRLDAQSDELTGEFFVIVTHVGAHQFGIIVDQVFDTEEIVVKPVARALRQIPYYSGNTLLGDGSIVMILDPNGIAGSTEHTAASNDDPIETAAPRSREEISAFLIFRAGSEERKAVPMALVARLEYVEMKTVEVVAGQRVVQYRGKLMPLISFDPGRVWKSEGRQPILVFTDRDRSMGLAVDDIVDIVEDELHIELSGAKEGVIGSAVIAGKATDVVDVRYYLTQAFEDWFSAERYEQSEMNPSKKLLLVDDSRFFRNLFVPYLSAAGFDVVTADSATAACGILEEGDRYAAIVSDIEMQDVDGFQFAAWVREKPKFKSVPLIALSSFTSKEVVERGMSAGFDKFVSKTQATHLLDALREAA